MTQTLPVIRKPLVPHRLLFILWCAVNTLFLLLMLTHRSDEGVILGRYSATFTIQLVAMLGLSVVTCIAAFLPRLPDIPLTGFPRIALMVVLVVLPALAWLLIPGSRSQPAVILFRLYVVVILLGVMLVLVRGADLPASRRVPVFLVFAVCTAFLMVFAVLYSGDVPLPLFWDESWIASQGLTSYLTGVPSATILPEMPPERAVLLSSLIPVSGFWLSLTGMSLETARMFWLFVAWLSVPFVFLLARQLYGMYAGIVAALLMAWLTIFHVYIRPDLFAPVALAAGLYFYFRGQKNGRRFDFFLAGFALAITAEGHVLATRFAIIVGLIMCWTALRRMWAARRLMVDWPLVMLAAGGALAVVVYMAVRVLPYGLSLSEILSEGLFTVSWEQQLGASAVAESPLQTIANFAQPWFGRIFSMHPIEVIGWVGITVFWLTRRTSANQQLLAIWVGSQVLLFLLLPKEVGLYYWSHQLPLVAIGTGGLVAALIKRGSTLNFGIPHALLLAAISLLFLSHAIVVNGTRDGVRQSIDVAYAVHEWLPDEVERIGGRGYFYFGLDERDFLSLENVTVFLPTVDARVASIERFDPQAFLAVPGLDESHMEIYSYLGRSEMRRVGCFPIDIYAGVVEVYALPDIEVSDEHPCPE